MNVLVSYVIIMGYVLILLMVLVVSVFLGLLEVNVK